MKQTVRQSELSGVNIAVASNSVRHRHHLHKVLERTGLRVVLNEPLSEIFLVNLSNIRVDVILLDIDEKVSTDNLVLDQLFEDNSVPLIFNDVTALTLNEPAQLAKWYGILLHKIAEITGKLERESLDFDVGHSNPIGDETSLDEATGLARNVWVLGASLGGPEAVKEFLSALPEDLPVAFILAQHLGANFMTLLAEQLNRMTSFHVVTAKVGHVVRHGEVIVAPVRERLLINPVGAIELKPQEEEVPYNPSINTVITDMAQKYTQRSGAIIFSGMCDDGVKGAISMNMKGGQVWAQDAENCVISAMSDSARATGAVSYTGTPVQLAKKLVHYFSQ